MYCIVLFLKALKDSFSILLCIPCLSIISCISGHLAMLRLCGHGLGSRNSDVLIIPNSNNIVDNISDVTGVPPCRVLYILLYLSGT